MQEINGADTSSVRLIALLTEQRDLYRRLRELSTRQRTLIAGDRPEQLLAILQERQTLIAALMRLNQDLGPFRRDWDAMYAALPDDVREQAGGLLNEINGLLGAIIQTDQEDSALLSARKQSVAGELKDVNGSRSASSAYARQAGAGQRGAGADLTG